MVKTDRNCAEDFCHPPGAVCTVSFASSMLSKACATPITGMGRWQCLPLSIVQS
jgi:hypothetical protein